MSKYLFSSESVTEGHPDKIADQVSDAVLDAILAQDEKARVACETFVTTGMALIGGEISTDCYVDIPTIARGVIKKIGYDHSEYGFDYKTCAILTTIDKQASDIAMGVDRGGAGDQGMMFGYATRETEQLMPLPISLAHDLTRKLSELRKEDILAYLRPDGKSQVTVVYEDDKPVAVNAVVISTQHDDKIDAGQLENDIKNFLIRKVIPENLYDENMKIFVNPTGRFVTGGPQGDAGLTGRKIIVDTYGGFYSHGGGAFSGKDPSKVDRSGSYYARYVAKNIVASGLADKAGIQVAYAIGVAEPVSIMVDTFGTGKMSDEELTRKVEKVFDFRPRAIIEQLDLLRPIYGKTAAYGHFGRTDVEFPWERTDKADELAG
jgi:S-adenosylmethionine synthetase